MNRISINQFAFCLVLSLSSISENNAQRAKIYPPYYIDIKKNINNIEVINLSTIGKELTFIPLETKPECLIQNIKKVLFSNSYIFISEFSKLLQFDRNGKFIRLIGSTGSGPGEYLSVGDFCFDEKKKEICIILSSGSKLLIFGFDGVFKNSVNISFKPAQIIQKDDNILMFHLWNVPGKNDPSWILTNRQGITQANFKNNLKRTSQPGFLINQDPIILFENYTHFMEFGIDTLYYMKKNKKYPYGIFSFDDLKMDIDPIVTPSQLKDKKLLNKLWIGSILESSRFLFIKFFRGMSNSTMCAVFDKETNTLSILKDNVFKNDLGGGIGFWPKQIVDDKIAVDYVDAFELLKKTIPSELRRRISETSNPVIVMLK